MLEAQMDQKLLKTMILLDFGIAITKGLKLYEQPQTYTFHYVDHDERAELGVQHCSFLLGLRSIGNQFKKPYTQTK